MEADGDGAGALAADGEVHAAAGGRGGSDEGGEVAFEAELADRVFDEAALPDGVGAVGHVLDGAAAAGAEMGAWGDDAVGGGCEDGRVGGPGLAAFFEGARLDAFAGQSIGEEERGTIGRRRYSVAVSAQGADDNRVNRRR